MENFTMAIYTGFGDMDHKPIVMFFVNRCLMIQKGEDYVRHIFMD